MKRMLCLIMLIFSLLGFSSCSGSVNMEKLTQYQKGDFSATAHITLDGVKYRTDIKKSGESLSFSFTEPSELAEFTFIVNENGVFLQTDGLNVPINAGEELLKLSYFANLFDVPTAGTWKIEKSAPGGVSVYVCKNESENVILYIDAGSNLPLKIVCGGTEADIISFEQG